MKKIIVITLALISQITNGNTLLNSECLFDKMIHEISEGHIRPTQKTVLSQWHSGLKDASERLSTQITRLNELPNPDLEKIRSLKDAKVALSALKRAKNEK